MPHSLEQWIFQALHDVLLPAREVVIYTEDIATPIQELIAKMGAEEPGSPGHHDSRNRQHEAARFAQARTHVKPQHRATRDLYPKRPIHAGVPRGEEPVEMVDLRSRARLLSRIFDPRKLAKLTANHPPGLFNTNRFIQNPIVPNLRVAGPYELELPPVLPSEHRSLTYRFGATGLMEFERASLHSSRRPMLHPHPRCGIVFMDTYDVRSRWGVVQPGHFGFWDLLTQKNYYHWMANDLPRLMLLERAGIKNILTPVDIDALPHYAKQSLELLDPALTFHPIDGKGDINYERLSVPVIPDEYFGPEAEGEVLFMDYQTHTLTRWAIECIQDLNKRALKLRPDPALVAATKIRIRRGDGREISNAQNVDEALQDIGFVILRSETLSFVDQLVAFSGATHVFGIHGAGLVNLAGSTLGQQTQVIEAAPGSFYNRNQYGLHSRVLTQIFFHLASVANGNSFRYVKLEDDWSLPPDRILEQVRP